MEQTVYHKISLKYGIDKVCIDIVVGLDHLFKVTNNAIIPAVLRLGTVQISAVHYSNITRRQKIGHVIYKKIKFSGIHLYNFKLMMPMKRHNVLRTAFIGFVKLNGKARLTALLLFVVFVQFAVFHIKPHTQSILTGKIRV